MTMQTAVSTRSDLLQLKVENVTVLFITFFLPEQQHSSRNKCTVRGCLRMILPQPCRGQPAGGEQTTLHPQIKASLCNPDTNNPEFLRYLELCPDLNIIYSLYK